MSTHLDNIAIAYGEGLAREQTAYTKPQPGNSPSKPIVLSSERLLSISEAVNIGSQADADGDSILPYPSGRYRAPLYLDDPNDSDAKDVLAAAAWGDTMAECLAVLGVRSRIIYQALALSDSEVSPIETTLEPDKWSSRRRAVHEYGKYAEKRDAALKLDDIDESIETIEKIRSDFVDLQTQAKHGVDKGSMPISLYVRLVALRNSEENQFATEMLARWEDRETPGVYTA